MEQDMTEQNSLGWSGSDWMLVVWCLLLVVVVCLVVVAVVGGGHAGFGFVLIHTAPNRNAE